MPPDATDLIPEALRENIARNGLPDVVYAVAGVVDLAQSEAPGFPDLLADLPSAVTAAPTAVMNRISDQIRSVTTAATDSAGSVAALAGEQAGTVVSLAGEQVAAARTAGAQLGESLAAAYATLVQRGEQRVVAETAERAVRKRVSRIEDSVAPRAARAAVQIQDRRRRWRESERLRGLRKTTQQTQQTARRSMARFEEFNAPVLADPE